MIPNNTQTVLDSEEKSQKNTILLVYILQAMLFFVVITYIVAIVINHINKNELQSTWLASHNRWQMRTFWFSLLWYLIGSAMLFLLIGWVILVANSIWVIYRIAKGWIRLNNGTPMYT